MSRIYDALERSGGTVADLVLPVAGRAGQAKSPPEPPAAEPVTAQATVEQGVEKEEVAGADPFRTVSLETPEDSPLLLFDRQDSRAGEQYRIIRTKIIQHARQPRLLVVSSPELGDGKSVTAANIATTLALKPDTRVLLVDADFRRSSITRLLGIGRSSGLSELLGGTCSVEDAMIRVGELPSLYVLPAGGRPQNPTELLDSPRWTDFLQESLERFSFVILDGPPVGLVADYDLIQAAAEGVILVVRPDHTHRRLCMQALEAIPADKLVGVVMNCVPRWFLWKTLGSHDYSYYSRGSEEASAG
jgi:capsular exopolysaccharide synthesis family protein